VGAELSRILATAKFICKKNLNACGRAPHKPGPNRIYIGPPGFDPTRCGSLSCTLIHEATHRTQWFYEKRKEEGAQAMEKKCCGL
jgi:hypothetical protein